MPRQVGPKAHPLSFVPFSHYRLTVFYKKTCDYLNEGAYISSYKLYTIKSETSSLINGR